VCVANKLGIFLSFAIIIVITKTTQVEYDLICKKLFLNSRYTYLLKK
jgi:hypothetical protein